jgi:hypothetical protein
MLSINNELKLTEMFSISDVMSNKLEKYKFVLKFISNTHKKVDNFENITPLQNNNKS